MTRPFSAGTDSPHQISAPTNRAPSMRGDDAATDAAEKGEGQLPKGDDMPRAYGPAADDVTRVLSRQTARRTATTLPSTTASSPRIGSKEELRGSSHV